MRANSARITTPAGAGKRASHPRSGAGELPRALGAGVDARGRELVRPRLDVGEAVGPRSPRYIVNQPRQRIANVYSRIDRRPIVALNESCSPSLETTSASMSSRQTHDVIERFQLRRLTNTSELESH
jgi:hypothetical protein